MSGSFMRYRIDGDSENESNDTIEINSSTEASFIKNKTVNGKGVGTVIPDSDAGSDTEIEEDQDESFIPQVKKSTKSRVISDTESEDESDYGERNAMSVTTRLSIFGVKPPGANSEDESDFIESDYEEKNVSNHSPEISLSEMQPNPHVELFERSVSPTYEKSDQDSNETSGIDKKTIKTESVEEATQHNESIKSDSSVQILQRNSSIIDLSSDDEEKQPSFPVSPIPKPNPLEQNLIQPKITNFAIDHTYPNSGVRYVKKQIKENELNKLNGLKVDLQKVQYLLESMNLSELPDKGYKLSKRAEDLKAEIRKQAELVSNLIVEPETVEPKHIKNDGFVSWEDIKTGIKSVQPTKFGEQAMMTNNIQRNVTLASLNLLYKSLESRPGEEVMADMPRGLKTQLMPHQLHALAWLKWRESQKPRGGILADDMGLGKTLTMISLIVSDREKGNVDDDSDEETYNGGDPLPTLVVCPASLLKQWHNEIMNHCKKNLLKAHIHHGFKREVVSSKLARNDVVITTYNLIQRELDMKGTLTRIKWGRVILDEAHIVRNYKSKTARAVFQLTSKTKWCLTGTPLHNKDLDLFALLKFIKLDPFDDIGMWKRWIDNKSTQGQERLFMIMKILLLRRTKQQLQLKNALGCLPTKSIDIISVELSKDEMNVYQKVLVFSKTLFAQFLHQRAERNNSVSFKSSDYNEEYYKMHKRMAALHGAKPVKSHEILVLILRLRQICCHAGLIHSMLNDEEYEGRLDSSQSNTTPEVDLLGELAKLNIENGENLGAEEDNVDEGGEEQSVATAMSKILKSTNPVFNLERKSAKISAALDCLKDKVFVREGDRAIVVSQWTSMLDIIEGHLKEMGVVCSTLSGKVPVTVRHEIVNKFNDPNSNIQVLLLSLCAGGVGLNLVGGNHLLLLDLHWNPQLEAQAQDRIYRVGQHKPVYIYKFMCKSTIEQSIKMIQDKKLTMAENVLTGSISVQSSKLTIEEIKLMFNMV